MSCPFKKAHGKKDTKIALACMEMAKQECCTKRPFWRIEKSGREECV